MKRLMCMLAVIGATLWLASTARAEYLGTLQRDEGWVLNVDNTGGFDPGTAVTIRFVLGKRDAVVVRTVPAHERAQISFPAPLPNDVLQRWPIRPLQLEHCHEECSEELIGYFASLLRNRHAMRLHG